LGTIRRGKLPTDNFTIIPNDYARDDRLSWGARGLLAWCMSHAVAFEITEERMIAAGPSGRDGVRGLVRELEGAGYLRRDKSFIPGTGTKVDYVLTDPCDGKPVVSDDGKPVAPSYREDQEKTKTPSVSSRAPRSDRGTRLPEDFAPDEKMREWYAAEGLERAGLNGRLEHQKFMNYWLSKPGAAGRKTDWRRTWMNWMLQAAERCGGRPGNAVVPTSGAPYSQTSKTNQRVAEGMALVAKFEQMEKAK